MYLGGRKREIATSGYNNFETYIRDWRERVKEREREREREPEESKKNILK